MKLSEHLRRRPCFVAFGQANSGSGITSVDLAAGRDANSVTVTASDGSAAPIAAADAGNAGVMSAADKIKLDGLANPTTRGFPDRASAVAAKVDGSVTHLRTAGHSAAGDGGGALYARVGAQPAHPLYLQSADGAYWELVPEFGRISVRQAGAVGDGVADDHAAFAAAIDAFPTNVSLNYRGSMRIVVPEGEYLLGSTLEIHSTVILEGQGAGGGDGGASVLTWPADTPGIVIQRMNTTGTTTEVPDDGSTKGGDATIIRNLKLAGSGSYGAPADGIRLRARATVEECVIEGFPRDGIHVSATSGGSGNAEGNANQWRVHNTRLFMNRRHGLYVDGSDANSGIATSVDASSNGRWGLFDSSFLGNSYVGCHSATNGLKGFAGNAGSSVVHYNGPENGNQDIRYAAARAASEASLVATVPGTDGSVWIRIAEAGASAEVPTWLPSQAAGTYFTGGAFATDNPNARTVLLGCYTEIGQGPAQIVRPTQVIGGLQGAGVAGDGFHLDGNQVGLGNLMFVPRDDDSRAGMELDLRRYADSMIYANVDGDHPSGTQLLSWFESNKTWAIGQHANLAGRIPAEFTTDLTTVTFGRASAPGGGYALFNRGLFLGSIFDGRHISYGAVAPASGEHGKGDFVFNRLTSATGILGWTCVTGGSPGTWEEIAVVTKTAWDDIQARVAALEGA